VTGECVGCLETVAGDARHGNLIGRYAAVGVEPCGDCGRDAACGLGEDAFGLGELLYAGDDLDVGYIFCPTTAAADHLGCGGAVGWVADGEGAGDGVGALGFDVVGARFDGD